MPRHSLRVWAVAGGLLGGCGQAIAPVVAPRQAPSAPTSSRSNTAPQALTCARSLPPTSALPLDIQAATSATGDLDGDGCPDLVLNDGAGNLRLVFDRSAGLTVVSRAVPITGAPHIADANGDGLPDLVFQRSGAPFLDVMLNDGAGSFDVVTSYPEPSPGNLGEIAVGDFDGDGFADVASSCDDTEVDGEPEPARCIRYGGPAGFATPVVLATGSALADLHAADVDGAGRPQVVIHWIAPHAGQGYSGQFIDSARTPQDVLDFELDYHSFGGAGSTFADVDGDGRDDFVWFASTEPAAYATSSTGYATDVVGLQLASAPTANGQYSAIPFSPAAWAVGRFDTGAGRTLALIGWPDDGGTTRQLVFRTGRTDGTFAPDRESTIDLGSDDLLFANALDLDRNGHDDLVVTTSARVIVVMNP